MERAVTEMCNLSEGIYEEGYRLGYKIGFKEGREEIMRENVINLAYEGFSPEKISDLRELLRLIEVGASCFNHYCTGCDFSQRSVLHNVHRRIRSGYSIPTFCLCC